MQLLAWEGVGGGGMGWRWQGDGWLGLAIPAQKCNFWKVLRLARNPSKKMRLDESFRMVQSACQSVAYIKSYGQKTKVIARENVAYFFELQWLCDVSRCNY